MAYMNQECKAKIAAALKAIPGLNDWSYSLRVSSHSTIVMTIRTAPFDLLAGYVKDGKRTVELPKLDAIRDYVRQQLDTEIWEEEQRFENPHRHYLDMTPDYYEMKMGLLYETRKQHG